jgi:hypothetical protein
MFNTILNLAAAAKNTGSTKGVGHRCDKDEQILIGSFNSALRLAVTKTDYPRLSAPAGPSNFTQKILAKTRQIRYHFFRPAPPAQITSTVKPRNYPAFFF